MMNFILASTSTVHGSPYLEYLKNELEELFLGVHEILFIPYARPSGLTHDAYTEVASKFFETINIKVKGIHTLDDKLQAIQQAKGIFTGGGNTFLLVKTLHELDIMETLKDVVSKGTPYLGTSAGSNIAGINIKTTNDMPIVFASSFDAMGLIPYNINPHYLDPDPNSTHKGETRETRILEFLTQNDETVIGLREGNWIRGWDNKLTLQGNNSTRIFIKNQKPLEVDPGFDLENLKS